jgi:hypothetical protein
MALDARGCLIVLTEQTVARWEDYMLQAKNTKTAQLKDCACPPRL